MSWVRACCWAAGAAALGTLLVVITVFRTAVTEDELHSYDYGRRVVFEGRFDRLTEADSAKLPVLALNALPERVAAGLGWRRSAVELLLAPLPLSSPARDYILAHLPIYAGRLVTLVFYLGLCALVFAWGTEVYGPSGTLGATVLTASVPTLLGHSALFSSDAAASCMILAAVYALARCLLDPSVERSVVAGVAGGLALLTKYSATALVPVALTMVVLRTLTAERLEPRARVFHGSLVAVVIAGLVALLVVSAGFAFQHPFTRLTEIACDSSALHGARGLLGGLPLPLPRDFLIGLDRVGSLSGATLPLGGAGEEGSSANPLVASLLRMPLPLFLLLLTRPWRWHRRYTDLVWLTPVAWVGVHLSLSPYSQIGLRSLLPAFPFLALLAAGSWDADRPRRWRQLASVLTVLAVVEAVWGCPRYLWYFGQP